MEPNLQPDFFRHLRVLIVDDNAFARKLERSMLRQLGVTTVAEAASGIEAMEAIAVRECDFILLDWKMPHLSGEDFLRLLRNPETSQHHRLPVLVATGFASRTIVLKAARLGADGVIVKPFSIARLGQHIQAILKERNTAPTWFQSALSSMSAPAAEAADGHDEMILL